MASVSCFTGTHTAPPDQPPSSAIFATVRGIAVHYRESRPLIPGETWLLLIHGFGASLESWHDIVPLLASSIRIVRLDLKGFGQTDRARDDLYTLEEQAEIVTELINKVGMGRVIIAGHSYGGAVAFLTYFKMRERGSEAQVAGLVLIDPASYSQSLPFFVANLRNPVIRRGQPPNHGLNRGQIPAPGAPVCEVAAAPRCWLKDGAAAQIRPAPAS